MTNENHPNWKGGICSLYNRLRTFSKKYIPLVLERDGHTCKLCGSHDNLQVHHIIPFKYIIKNICDKNPQLNCINNINELYQISIKDEKLNDINNLITYCKDCHLYKIHKYNKIN